MHHPVANLFRNENRRHIDVSIDSADSHALLLHLAHGIAQYALGMRRYSATDRIVDRYVAETLSDATFATPLDTAAVGELLYRAKTIRDRAATLVGWAAEANARPPRRIADGFDYLYGDVDRMLFRIKQSRADIGLTSPDLERRMLCEMKIQSFAKILLTAPNPDIFDFDAFGFVHKTLVMLYSETDLSNLGACLNQIEERMLHLVQSLISGGTVVELQKAEM